MTPETLKPTKPISRLRRECINRAFAITCASVAILAAGVLLVLIVSIAIDGARYLSWTFLTENAHYLPDQSGFFNAVVGSLWICIVCALTALPIGIGAAIYLNEFAPRSRFTRFIQLNISNLAGVPSVVYGLIGLAVFVSFFNIFNSSSPVYATPTSPNSIFYLGLPFGRSVLAGGLTLALVVLPVVIIATQEALRAVPNSLREGSLALGSTRWQTVRRMILPAALPGIMTGSILSLSRAIGETAPILVVGASLYYTAIPANLLDSYSAMPVQIYAWAGDTNPEFHKLAASGIVVLLAVLLTFNAAAIFIRAKFQRPLS
ncbi:MAG: phosphate ABC transporter, permease protein PstA [Phycisphaeraceae bacterium]|nr:MAG: phosphate ABC transporter, permease protein PstA [Phycisphaeraceae bacterium]